MNDCIIWGGVLRAHDRRPIWGKVYMYRVALALKLNRPIRPGHVVDHICGNPSCVNPEHLQEVTQSEHMAAEIGRGRVAPGDSNVGQAAKTHCPQGHEYTPENTYVYVRKTVTPKNRAGAVERHCIQCRRERQNRRS